MPFKYTCEEDKRDRHKYIVITGYEGNIRDLKVPDTIEGIRVEAIGNHSFSGRQDLEEVTLPETVRILYGFSFHNCRNLKKISLYDSIDDYYDGVCRQCDSLSEVDITVNRGWFEVIRNFLADNDKTLRFMINVKSDDSLSYVRSCLTFPEYVYDFNENTMARTIQFSIAGSGMFYRECVDRRSINYREYDRLFDKARIDGGRVAQEIAVGRLLHPVQLSDDFRRGYESYVKENGADILDRLVKETSKEPRAVNTLKDLLAYGAELFDEESIDVAIKSAADKKLTEVSALLMNANKQAGHALSNKFVF